MGIVNECPKGTCEGALIVYWELTQKNCIKFFQNFEI